MKKILVSLTMLLLAASLMSPASGREVITTRQDELAIATWVFPTLDPAKSKLYAVAVWGQEATGQAVKKTAYLVQGTCSLTRSGKERCTSDSFLKTPVTHGFTMAEDASEASLDITHRGTRYKVTWAGEGPDLGHWFESCYSSSEDEPVAEGHGAGFIQQAQVQGNGFGRSLPNNDEAGGVLFRGVTATRCASVTPLVSHQGGGELWGELLTAISR